jgi:hypothetical protein
MRSTAFAAWKTRLSTDFVERLADVAIWEEFGTRKRVRVGWLLQDALWIF